MQRPIASDGVASSVCLLVCQSACLLRPSALKKTAEPIETPFGMWTWVGPRKHVLDGSLDPRTKRGNFEGEKGHARTCLTVNLM